ncbi:MAG TPA: hypothetical protein VGQ81_09630 [Acidobacteriota bacterium]|jgi:hypothetical protein|nr:hypothetical protein [Acidobacteriota bacterium]
MPVTIQFSKFGNPKAAELIRESVNATFKSLPDKWTVTINSRCDDPKWKMIIHGPQNFELELTLEAGEHDAESVTTAIRHAIVGELSG